MADPDVIISADTNALVVDAIGTESIGPATLKAVIILLGCSMSYSP